jgi:lipoprotein-releasing system permease protein
MPYELRIALRYLTARRKQAFISVISGVSILGVTVGVMALMIALGLMTGLQGEIRSRILGATAHLSLFRSGSGREGMESYREVVDEVRKQPHVLGAAPAIYSKGLISSGTSAQPATIKGILPALEKTVTELASQVDSGSLDALDASASVPPPILLGRDLAIGLGVSAGDVVTVTSPNGRLSPVGLLPRVSKFRVVGTVRTGLYEFDSGWTYVPLAAAQRLFDMGDRATLVEVRTDDMYAVKETGPAILGALGPDYVLQDWIEMNRSLFTALKMEKIAIGITIFLIVMVAALNIVAALVMMVMEKHQDIAILVSMGASRGAIARIFMLQGTMIGAVGTFVGGVLGYGTCRILDAYKLVRVSVEVYQVSYVPFKLQALDATLVVTGAMLICFVAALYPSFGASRLDPAEALRYE